MIRLSSKSLFLSLSMVAALSAAGQVLAADQQSQDKEDIERMVLRYKGAVGMNPKNSKNRIKLGQAYLLQRKLDDAQLQFEEASKLVPDQAEPYIGIYRVLVQKGDQKGAAQAIKNAAARDPNNADVHFKAGQMSLASDKLDEAIVSFRQSIKLKDTNADVHRELGIALGLKGDVGAQESEEKKALQLQPNDSEALYYLAMAYVQQDKRGDAIKALEKCVQLDPKNAEAFRTLAGVKAASGQFKEAIALAQKAVDLKPADAQCKKTLDKIKAKAPK
jgi:cytochrome c-type biogenesis protein CcmH/NrfG